MNLAICAIYDSKAERYIEPFTVPTVAVAEREFTRLVNTDGHQFNNYPEDYTLFHLATMDQKSGKIDVLPAPYSVATAITLKQSATPLPFTGE